MGKNKSLNSCFYGRQTPTQYEIQKEKARNEAIDWQYSVSEKNYYMSEMAYYYEYFYKLAKRYGLIKEFKENGII